MAYITYLKILNKRILIYFLTCFSLIIFSCSEDVEKPKFNQEVVGTYQSLMDTTEIFVFYPDKKIAILNCFYSEINCEDNNFYSWDYLDSAQTSQFVLYITTSNGFYSYKYKIRWQSDILNFELLPSTNYSIISDPFAIPSQRTPSVNPNILSSLRKISNQCYAPDETALISG